MGGIDTDGHAGKALDHRDVGEVDEVTVRVAHIRFHSAQSENDATVAFTGQILGGVE